MTRRRKHTLWKVAGAGLGAWVAYRYVYRPWAQARALAASGGAANAGSLPFDPLGSLIGSLTGGIGHTLPAVDPLPPVNPLTMVTAPIPVGPVPSTGKPYPAGPVGACMQAKGGTWTQGQCEARLNDLAQAAQNARTALSTIATATIPNPAAAGIPAAQAELAANQAALAVANQQAEAARAAGDTNSAAVWAAAALSHQSDIADLTGRIAAASKPLDNAATRAAYEGQLAANDTDYHNLTGVHLVGGV